jgi:hypothetical protein
MFEQYDELEVNVSAEDKEILTTAMETISNVLQKYPYFKDSKSHFVTTMARAKNASNDLALWIRCLKVENAEREVLNNGIL